jgi:hypothetical protein
MSRYRYDQPSAPDVIFREISSAGDRGLIQKELLSTLGRQVHRATVFRVARRYEKERKIKVLREGNTVRYIATEKVPLDASMGAFMLTSQVASKLFIFPNIYEKAKTPNELPKTQDSVLEKALKEFSNIVGVIITFVLIQGLNPQNDLLLTKDGREREKRLVKDWINNAITPHFISRLLWQLQFLVYGIISTLSKTPKELGAISDFPITIPLSDKDIANILTKAFSRSFPEISKKLDDIMNNISRETAAPAHKQSRRARRKVEGVRNDYES